MSSIQFQRVSTLAELVTPVRAASRQICSPEETAELVAGVLRHHLPEPGILSAEQLQGDPQRYAQHVLHVEPDGCFSIVALVWRPGQATPVHDHVAWCVVGVLDGVEEETRYRLVDSASGPCLARGAMDYNPAGTVCGIAPPGDIHSVRNAGSQVAVSLHIYGADIHRLGSSVRRNYDLPIR
ncbi:MAG TPA: cysteine dioxygenase family protein [Mycobacteriales bacterium]|nr:cysteine dioxygenase family protein [Mycobacteriales bacterium]